MSKGGATAPNAPPLATALMPSVLNWRISLCAVEVEVGGGLGEVAGLGTIWLLGGSHQRQVPLPLGLTRSLKVSESDKKFRQVYLTNHAISISKGRKIHGIQCIKYKELCQSLVLCVVNKFPFYEGTSVFWSTAEAPRSRRRTRDLEPLQCCSYLIVLFLRVTLILRDSVIPTRLRVCMQHHVIDDVMLHIHRKSCRNNTIL